MANHPNRNWRSRWSVDLEAATATHIDGWIFQFHQVAPGKFDGHIVCFPKPLTEAHKEIACRIAREAGDVYIKARQERH